MPYEVQFVRLILMANAVMLSGHVSAQNAPQPPEPAIPDTEAVARLQPQEVPALAEGEVKVLEALIIDVRGRARWRADVEGADWSKAAVDQILKPGATISTGSNSSVTLRVGLNSTVHVGSTTRLQLPQIVQRGNTLITRAAMERGDVDIKVDRVGLINDFVVVTPTTTLAVEGTGFRMTAGALDGVQVRGIRENIVRAIEVSYFVKKVRYFLSGQGKTSESKPDPVRHAMNDTIGPAPIWAFAYDRTGLLSEGWSRELVLQSERRVESSFEGLRNVSAVLDEFDDDGNVIIPNDPFDGLFDGFGDTELQVAMLICDVSPDLIPLFESGLRDRQILDPQQYQVFTDNFQAICQSLGERDHPLFDLILEVVNYCSSLGSDMNEQRCYEVFAEAFVGAFQQNQ